MKLGFLVAVSLTVMVKGKLVIDKWDVQYDKAHLDIKQDIKDSRIISIDVHSLTDADDIVIDMEVSTKVDGIFNPVLKPEPAHVCKLHEHEEPLVKYVHDEIIKYGNITEACPLKKGGYYYMHNFVIDETKIPLPVPAGEYRFNTNASLIQGGNRIPLYSSEVIMKSI